jgi:hypothetical protein
MVLLDRISKVYEMVHLCRKGHNTSVFRLRIVKNICTSSDEKDTGERWTLGNDNVNETWEDEGEVAELTLRKLFPGHLEPEVSKDM